MTRLEEWPSSTEFGLQARLLMWPRSSMRGSGPLYLWSFWKNLSWLGII